MSLAFCGSKTPGLAALEQILRQLGPLQVRGILCPDDRADSRSILPQFERIAREHGLPLEVAASTDTVVEALDRWQVSVAIVHGWYQRIPLERLPDVAFFGMHASPLPRYRGAAPLVWQVLDGVEQVGLSCMKLTPELDAGGIVARRFRPLEPNDTIGDLVEWVGTATLDILRDHLSAILDGSVALEEQDHDAATYAGWRVPADGAVDWTWSASRVHNAVRAQTHPYPGAFTFMPGGRRLTLWRSQRDERRWSGVPGGVAERRADGAVTVTCGSGAVLLHEVEVEGDETRPAADVLRSLSVRLGRV